MLAKLPQRLHVGSYSTGTLRIQDIIPVMFEVLWELSPDRAEVFRNDYTRAVAANFADNEEAMELWVQIEQSIDSLLPRGYIWGTAEGDGADFGIWEIPHSDASPKAFIVRIKAREGDDGADAKAVMKSTLDYDIERDKIASYEVLTPLMRKRYISESSGHGKYSVYEYSAGGSCLRTLQYGAAKLVAQRMADLLNDAIEQFIADNNLEVANEEET